MTDQRKPQAIVNKKDGSELIRIPTGPFLVGDDLREVEVPEFWIGKYPVTNDQYRRFVADTEHREPENWDGRRVWESGDYNGPQQPVVCVSCDDAQAYCDWAGLRLPAGQEWEKAARGTDGREWPWGNEEPTGELCNFDDNVGHPTEVGSYPKGASPYGCLDMAGNVDEWTATAAGSLRQVRGGGDYSSAAGVRCACWYYDDPGFRCNHCGFRVCASPAQVSDTGVWK